MGTAQNRMFEMFGGLICGVKDFIAALHSSRVGHNHRSVKCRATMYHAPLTGVGD